MRTAKRCYNILRAGETAASRFAKEKERERKFTCSFGERLLGRCGANPLVLRVSAWHRACLPSEDAEEHS
jgi:hypothetical protein